MAQPYSIQNRSNEPKLVQEEGGTETRMVFSPATAAELLALRATAAQHVRLAGYHSAGDGGGGSLYWDPNSTDTHNGGTIFKCTNITTGRYKRHVRDSVTIKEFGASASQTAAYNTSAIQAAIDAMSAQGGGRVIVPPGTYSFTTLTMPAFVHLVGMSPIGSKLVTTSGSAFAITGTAQSDWSVENISIQSETGCIRAISDSSGTIDYVRLERLRLSSKTTAVHLDVQGSSDFLFPELRDVSVKAPGAVLASSVGIKLGGAGSGSLVGTTIFGGRVTAMETGLELVGEAGTSFVFALKVDGAVRSSSGVGVKFPNTSACNFNKFWGMRLEDNDTHIVFSGSANNHFYGATFGAYSTLYTNSGGNNAILDSILTGGRNFSTYPLLHSDLQVASAGAFSFDTGDVKFHTGTGSPEGAVAASPGSVFLRQDGGASTTFYVKTSGTGNTGWTAK